MLHEHDCWLTAHAPFQHTTGVMLGHLCVQASSSATQTPFAAQRYGSSSGQGHTVRFAAQLMSQHCTSVAAHTVRHCAASDTHEPPLQRTGINGGHEHSRSDDAQLESQH
jgi:hypothetical protein